MGHKFVNNFEITIAAATLFTVIAFLFEQIFRGEMPTTIVFSISGVILGISFAVIGAYVWKTFGNRRITTVFLVYSFDSSDFATRLAAGLRLNGISVLSLTDEIKPGERITSRIKSLLKQADSVVVLVSPLSTKSKWISKEIEIAQELGKRIYPVVLGDSKVPAVLRNIMYISAGDSISETVEQLAEALKSYYNPTSQLDLNNAAAADLQAASAELEKLYKRLLDTFEDEDKEDFIEVQRAWKNFVKAQAKFAAASWRGGTGAQLLYYDELDTLTRARIAELRRMEEDDVQLD